MTKLKKEFYTGDTLNIAKNLLGKYLIREINSHIIKARITETEAYIGAIDKACHAYGGKRTQRTATLFMEGSHAYVYMIYGMYNCLNVVTGSEGDPNAVLIRGVEITDGLEYSAKLRYNKELNELSKYQLKNFSNGPGKVCKALAIDRRLDKHSLLSSPLYITEGDTPDKINISKRINIDYAEEARDFMWRFYL